MQGVLEPSFQEFDPFIKETIDGKIAVQLLLPRGHFEIVPEDNRDEVLPPWNAPGPDPANLQRNLLPKRSVEGGRMRADIRA